MCFGAHHRCRHAKLPAAGRGGTAFPGADAPIDRKPEISLSDSSAQQGVFVLPQQPCSGVYDC